MANTGETDAIWLKIKTTNETHAFNRVLLLFFLLHENVVSSISDYLCQNMTTWFDGAYIGYGDKVKIDVPLTNPIKTIQLNYPIITNWLIKTSDHLLGNHKLTTTVFIIQSAVSLEIHGCFVCVTWLKIN